MKRVFSATCFALVCAVGLSAQTAPKPQDTKPATDTSQAAMDKDQKAKPSAPAEKTVTLTGCLRAGDTPNSYVLANATESTAATPKTDEPAAPPDNPPVRPDQPTTPPTSPTQPPYPSTPPSAPPQPPTNPGNPPVTPTTPPTATDPPSNPEAGAPVGTAGVLAASGDVRLIGAPAGMDLKAHVGHTVKITGMWVPQGKGAAGATGTSGKERSLNVKSFSHVSDTCK